MFGKSRPIPSKGALRVLYQLAYISSGTAVGVAALCAEERRRRTVICQKIAENAKRLRQSPRYVGNVAKGRGDDVLDARLDEEVDDALDGEEKSLMASRTANLPSEVERNYRNLIEGRPKGKRKKMEEKDGGPKEGGLESKDPPLATGQMGDPGKPHRLELLSELRKARQMADRVEMGRRRMAQEAEIKRQTHEEVRTSHRSVRLALSMSIGRVLWDPKLDFEKNMDWNGSETEVDEDREAATATQPEMQEIMKRWPSAQSYSLLTSDRLAGTADPMASKGDLELGVETSDLLAQALEQGKILEVQRLIQLKTDTNMVTQLDLQLLCRSAATLVQMTEPEQLFKLFCSVLNAESVCALPMETQVSAALTLVAQAKLLAPIKDTRLPTVLEPVLERCLTKAISPALAQIEEKLTLLCRTLLAGGVYKRAMNFFENVIHAVSRIAHRREFDLSRDYCHRVLGEFFSAAMTARRLDLCSALLRLSWRKHFLDGFETMLHDAAYLLPQTEFDHVLHSTLLAIPKRSLSEPQFDIIRSIKCLDGKARAILVRESLQLADPPVRLLETLYGPPLPENSCRSIVEFMGRGRLQKSWSATRNFDHVWAEYEASKAFFTRADVSVSSIDSDITMVEICTEANQLERALELLSAISQSNAHSSKSLSAAAAILAKKGSWAQLEQLLGLLREPGKTLERERISRNLNSVIQLYSLKHSVQQTWDFVVNLVDMGIFRPNRHTSFVMLNIFVASGSLDSLERIKQWFCFLRDRQYTTKLETNLVVSMVWTFYIKNRPAHTQLMWYCRTLLNEAPGLNAVAFRDVAKEAVAYDLRKIKDKELLLKGRENLRRLQEDRNDLPEPITRAEHQELLQSRKLLVQSPGAGYPRLPSVGLTRHDAAEQTLSPEALAVSVPKQQEEKFEPFGFSNSEMAETDESLPAFDGPANDDEDALSDIMQLWNTHEDDQLDEPAMAIDADTGSLSEKPTIQPAPMLEPSQDLDTPNFPGRTGRVQVERDMILALSLRQYKSVLELYQRSLSSAGLPASPMALEVAVDACLRENKGNPEKAEQLLTSARDAGFNTVSAMGPLLLQRMWHMRRIEKKDAHRLQANVAEYYRLREHSGWPVKDHVGITAANILINNGRADEAIALLRAIYNSEWLAERPLNIVAMTVYLKAYSAVRYIEGVRWVFSEVLKNNMPIDRTFVAMVKYYTRPSFGKGPSRAGLQQSHEHFMHDLNRYHLMCVARRAQQKLDSNVFGWTLMRKLRWIIRWQIRENPNSKKWIHMANARTDSGLSTLQTQMRRSRFRSRTMVGSIQTDVDVGMTKAVTRKKLREMRLKAREKRTAQLTGDMSEPRESGELNKRINEQTRPMSMSEAMGASSSPRGKRPSLESDEQVEKLETRLPTIVGEDEAMPKEPLIELPNPDGLTLVDDPENNTPRVTNVKTAKPKRQRREDTEPQAASHIHQDEQAAGKKSSGGQDADFVSSERQRRVDTEAADADIAGVDTNFAENLESQKQPSEDGQHEEDILGANAERSIVRLADLYGSQRKEVIRYHATYDKSAKLVLDAEVSRDSEQGDSRHGIVKSRFRRVTE